MDADELREIFEFFDTDENGVIDKSEFMKLMNALGAGLSEAECETGFSVIDGDANGSIEFEEFAAWWLDRS